MRRRTYDVCAFNQGKRGKVRITHFLLRMYFHWRFPFTLGKSCDAWQTRVAELVHTNIRRRVANINFTNMYDFQIILKDPFFTFHFFLSSCQKRTSQWLDLVQAISWQNLIFICSKKNFRTGAWPRFCPHVYPNARWFTLSGTCTSKGCLAITISVWKAHDNLIAFLRATRCWISVISKKLILKCKEGLRVQQLCC